MNFLDNLPERIKNAQQNAAHGCGLSDVLYESRLQDSYESILNQAPQEDYDKVEAILRENGYDPDMEPFEAQEGECSLTGIDEYCCPCGRHE